MGLDRNIWSFQPAVIELNLSDPLTIGAATRRRGHLPRRAAQCARRDTSTAARSAAIRPTGCAAASSTICARRQDSVERRLLTASTRHGLLRAAVIRDFSNGL